MIHINFPDHQQNSLTFALTFQVSGSPVKALKTSFDKEDNCLDSCSPKRFMNYIHHKLSGSTHR